MSERAIRGEWHTRAQMKKMKNKFYTKEYNAPSPKHIVSEIRSSSGARRGQGTNKGINQCNPNRRKTKSLTTYRSRGGSRSAAAVFAALNETKDDVADASGNADDVQDHDENDLADFAPVDGNIHHTNTVRQHTS